MSDKSSPIFDTETKTPTQDLICNKNDSSILKRFMHFFKEIWIKNLLSNYNNHWGKLISDA